MEKYLKFTKKLEIKNILETTIMSHVVPQIECREAFCQFWAIFDPLLHFWTKNSKFSKNEKKS